MSFLIIQSALLMAIAYVLGCIIGCLLHYWFSVPEVAPIEEVESQSEAVDESVASDPKPVAVAEGMPKKDKKKKSKKKKEKKKKSKAKAKAKAKAKEQVEEKVVEKPEPKPKAKRAPRRVKDDLKRIRGIGPQNEAKLNALKITSFAQIAEWKAADINEIGERLEFGGRIKGEKWVSQAKTLAAGKETEFSKRVQKGEVKSSLGKGKA